MEQISDHDLLRTAVLTSANDLYQKLQTTNLSSGNLLPTVSVITQLDSTSTLPDDVKNMWENDREHLVQAHKRYQDRMKLDVQYGRFLIAIGDFSSAQAVANDIGSGITEGTVDDAPTIRFVSTDLEDEILRQRPLLDQVIDFQQRLQSGITIAQLKVGEVKLSDVLRLDKSNWREVNYSELAQYCIETGNLDNAKNVLAIADKSLENNGDLMTGVELYKAKEDLWRAHLAQDLSANNYLDYIRNANSWIGQAVPSFGFLDEPLGDKTTTFKDQLTRLIEILDIATKKQFSEPIVTDIFKKVQDKINSDKKKYPLRHAQIHAGIAQSLMILSYNMDDALKACIFGDKQTNQGALAYLEKIPPPFINQVNVDAIANALIRLGYSKTEMLQRFESVENILLSRDSGYSDHRSSQIWLLRTTGNFNSDIALLKEERNPILRSRYVRAYLESSNIDLQHWRELYEILLEAEDEFVTEIEREETEWNIDAILNPKEDAADAEEGQPPRTEHTIELKTTWALSDAKPSTPTYYSQASAFLAKVGEVAIQQDKPTICIDVLKEENLSDYYRTELLKSATDWLTAASA